MTRQFHAEELPTRAGLDKDDKFRLREFLRQEYRVDYQTQHRNWRSF